MANVNNLDSSMESIFGAESSELYNENGQKYYVGKVSGNRVSKPKAAIGNTSRDSKIVTWILDFYQSKHLGGKRSTACTVITIESYFNLFRQACSIPVLKPEQPGTLCLNTNSAFFQCINSGLLDGNILMENLVKRKLVKKGSGTSIEEAINYSKHGFYVADKTGYIRGTGHEIIRKCVDSVFRSPLLANYPQICLTISYATKFNVETNLCLSAHAALIVLERDPDRLVFVNSGRREQKGMAIVWSRYEDLKEFSRAVLPPKLHIDNNRRQLLCVRLIGIDPKMKLDAITDTPRFKVKSRVVIRGTLFKGLDSTANYSIDNDRDENMEDTCDFDENGCLLPLEDERKVEEGS